MLPANDGAFDMLVRLIDGRRDLLVRDGGWRDYSDDQRNLALSELEGLEDAILSADWDEPHARLHGFAMLLDGADLPNFADDFKNRLFELLRHGMR